MLEHPRAAIAELVTGWVLISGVLFGFGLLVTDHAEGTFLGTLDGRCRSGSPPTARRSGTT